MKDSIVINMKYADYDIIDGKPNVERHHIFGGPCRKLADEDGLWIPLTYEHHKGNMSVHHNKEMQVLSHIIGQQAWMMEYIIEQRGLPFEDIKEEAKEAFRKRYGKSYL